MNISQTIKPLERVSSTNTLQALRIDKRNIRRRWRSHFWSLNIVIMSLASGHHYVDDDG